MRYIEYNIADRIAYIVLNRPEKKNALNFPMVSEMREVLDELSDNEKVKVVIIKGNGTSFCAGADLAYLKQLQQNSYEENLADSEHLKELFYAIYTLNKVVIAQVHGYAIAGGCGLSTVCDFTFATDDSTFGYTEVKIGFVPAIVMTFLIRKIGEQRARELLLTGDKISSATALEYGLINKVIPIVDIEMEVQKFARHLVETNSGQSMSLTKQMIGAIQSKDLKSALQYAFEKNARARSFTDCKAGIEAFLNKEKISW